MRSNSQSFFKRSAAGLTAPAFTFALVWALTSMFSGQQATGQEMMRLSSDESLMIREIGAMTEMTDDGLRVVMAMPGEARPEAYREVDVRQGDLILMINGRRIRELAAAREVFDQVATGDEIALGIDRGGRTVIVRFPKADPASLPDRMVFRGGGPGGGHGVAMEQRMILQGDGELTPVMGLGVILEDAGEAAEVRVGMVLPGAATVLREGDVLRTLGGAAVESATWVEQAVERAEVGAVLEIEVVRGDEELTLRQPKSDARGSVRIRRQ